VQISRWHGLSSLSVSQTPTRPDRQNKVLDTTPRAQIPKRPQDWAMHAACEMTSAQHSKTTFCAAPVSSGPTRSVNNVMTPRVQTEHCCCQVLYCHLVFCLRPCCGVFSSFYHSTAHHPWTTAVDSELGLDLKIHTPHPNLNPDPLPGLPDSRCLEHWPSARLRIHSLLQTSLLQLPSRQGFSSAFYPLRGSNPAVQDHLFAVFNR
jgi:hypothetical protein